MTIRFGMMVSPQAGSLPLIVERWKRSEAMGFDSIFVADETAMEFPGVISHEAWVLLGVLARETARVTIGPLVTPITFRHPLLLAMSASTVDHASNGRLALGVGAGGGPRDEAGVGVHWTAKERVARLEEQVRVLDALLRGETVTQEDGYYRMRDAVVERPVQTPRPPLVIAAQGPRGIDIVGRYGQVWNSLAGQPLETSIPMEDALANIRRLGTLLKESCERCGRDPRTVRRSVLVWHYDIWASLDAFTDYVSRYREAGIDEFVVAWPRSARAGRSAAEREGLMERIASEVFPKLRA